MPRSIKVIMRRDDELNNPKKEKVNTNPLLLNLFINFKFNKYEAIKAPMLILSIIENKLSLTPKKIIKINGEAVKKQINENDESILVSKYKLVV